MVREKTLDSFQPGRLSKFFGCFDSIAHAFFEDIDETYIHLSLMAEFFGLRGAFSEQCQLYMWMLQLNSRLRASPKVSLESCVVLVSLGHIHYQYLDNAGEADRFFRQAEGILREQTESVPQILRSLFYTTLGHFQSSQGNFEQA